MEERQYYTDYVQRCYDALVATDKKLHDAYDKRNRHANILYANLNILEANNVSKSIIDDLIAGNRRKAISYVKEIDCSNQILSDIIRINLNQFLFLTVDHIPKLLAIIKYYDWLCRMPYVIFTTISHGINKELAKYIIRGDAVSLGTNLGKLQVVQTVNSDGIDYRASAKYYRQLVAQGLTPKTAKTPKGINWFITSTKAYNWKIKWIRSISNCGVFRHLVFYHFRKADYNKKLSMLIDKYGTNVEDIIESDGISLGDKLNYMISYDSNIMTRYKPKKTKKERLTNKEDNEYIRPKLN